VWWKNRWHTFTNTNHVRVSVVHDRNYLHAAFLWNCAALSREFMLDTGEGSPAVGESGNHALSWFGELVGKIQGFSIPSVDVLGCKGYCSSEDSVA
jgi:hypothetical protein